MNEYWVKTPAPGQFRGEGTWTQVSHEEMLANVGYLPTTITKKGETPSNTSFNSDEEE